MVVSRVRAAGLTVFFANKCAGGTLSSLELFHCIQRFATTHCIQECLMPLMAKKSVGKNILQAQKSMEQVRVETREQARVETREQARVETREQARVETREQAWVETREQARVETREQARVETREQCSISTASDAIADIIISCDGTWQKCGLASLNGAVFVIAHESGKVADYIVLSKALLRLQKIGRARTKLAQSNRVGKLVMCVVPTMSAVQGGRNHVALFRCSVGLWIIRSGGTNTYLLMGTASPTNSSLLGSICTRLQSGKKEKKRKKTALGMSRKEWEG